MKEAMRMMRKAILAALPLPLMHHSVALQISSELLEAEEATPAYYRAIHHGPRNLLLVEVRKSERDEDRRRPS